MTMKHNYVAKVRTRKLRAVTLTGLALLAVFLLLASPKQGDAQGTTEGKGCEAMSAEVKAPQAYETLYLTYVAQQNDLNDIQTAIRNMVPSAKIYGVASQNAIAVRGTAEDIALAKRILADLDRPRKTYRLTFSINDVDSGKRVGTQRFSMMVVSGVKTDLKQGNRVPLVTGTTDSANASPNSQVQYIDVGLSIDATMEEYDKGVRLRTKIEQSSVAEEKSGMGVQDPIIRQTTLQATSSLTDGKPVVLGAMERLGDGPGSTRHQEIEVVSELVK